MGCLFLAWIARMGIEGMIEGFAVDILRVGRQMTADGCGQVKVALVGHLNSYICRH